MNNQRRPLWSVADMTAHFGGPNLYERVGPHWLLGIGVEADGVGATPAGVHGEFPTAVEALFIVGDKPLPRLQRVQPYRLWPLVTPDVPDASSVACWGMLLIDSRPFRQGLHWAMLQSSLRRKWVTRAKMKLQYICSCGLLL